MAVGFRVRSVRGVQFRQWANRRYDIVLIASGSATSWMADKLVDNHITGDYELRLRNRMGIFKQKTHTKQSIVYTFVTTFGVGEGKHHSIVHSEVTMDDLFRSCLNL